uniref:Uncharacterized protein n=1 Tax=Oryza rufipogon TaxID=4529 RepID=A0A0E0NJS6_ORYRU
MVGTGEAMVAVVNVASKRRKDGCTVVMAEATQWRGHDSRGREVVHRLRWRRGVQIRLAKRGRGEGGDGGAVACCGESSISVGVASSTAAPTTAMAASPNEASAAAAWPQLRRGRARAATAAAAARSTSRADSSSAHNRRSRASAAALVLSSLASVVAHLHHPSQPPSSPSLTRSSSVSRYSYLAAVRRLAVNSCLQLCVAGGDGDSTLVYSPLCRLHQDHHHLRYPAPYPAQPRGTSAA